MNIPPAPHEQQLPEPVDYDHSAFVRLPEYAKLLGAIVSLGQAVPYLDEAGLAEAVANAAIGLSYAEQCPRCVHGRAVRLTPPSEVAFDWSRCLVKCRYVCGRCAVAWSREHALEPVGET